VLILDNASFRRKNALYDIADECGFRVLFIPPYSPDLNPFKKFWANVKRRLRLHMHNSLLFGMPYVTLFISLDYKLFNTITDTINLLQAAQVETEEIFIEQENPNSVDMCVPFADKIMPFLFDKSNRKTIY